jgi:hypothetical protein
VLEQYSAVLLLVPGQESRAVALAEESLELARRVGAPAREAAPRRLLADIARRRGDLARASALMVESLRLAWDHGLTTSLPDYLDEMAMIAEAQGRSTRAARLQGAVARMIEISGLQLDKPDIEAMKARGQAALGEVVWAEMFEEGYALSLEDAIAEALDQSKAEVKATSQLTPTDESRGLP